MNSNHSRLQFDDELDDLHARLEMARFTDEIG
jgi:hypothetical protein